jgi:acetylornithine deacetylase
MPSRASTLSDAALLARLVGFDSRSSESNLPIADFLCEYLDRPAIRLTRNPSVAGDKVNLVFETGPEAEEEATAGGGGQQGRRGAARRPGLVLSGHMDVVPPGEAGWESDPFVLADRGDRLVGRGACDMKGCLALAANLALAASERRLAQPLALLFTYDEEVGTLGARRLVESCPRAAALPSAVVIGEPTGLRVVAAHKGHLRIRVTLHGRSAHSGYPHLGQSAIEPAAAVVTALAALRRELETEAAPHAELFPEVPFVPLNIGTVHGGTAVNVVPERCTMELGLRPLPGMDSAALAARVESVVRGAVAPLTPDFTILSDSPPMLVRDEAPVLRRLCALTGQDRAGTVSFATDAGWLQRLGMDCVLFGPGSIDVAHRPNEFVPKSELAAARHLLQQAIADACETPATGSFAAGSAASAGSARGNSHG